MCLLEKFLKHGVIHNFGSSAVQFDYFINFRTVRIESTELATAITEKNEEVLVLGSCYLFKNALFCFPIHHARKDAVLNRIQDDRTVGTSCRLLVQSRTYFIFSKIQNKTIRTVFASLYQ